MIQKTLVLLKPDTVQRGLIGEALGRFERAGLKVVAMKLMMVPKELAEKHYPDARQEWLKGMGGKTLQNYKEFGVDPVKDLGTDDPLEIGLMINRWNIEFLTSGPIVALILEGNLAIDKVRKLIGFTIPFLAETGTLRGDYSTDSRFSPIRENVQCTIWFMPLATPRRQTSSVSSGSRIPKSQPTSALMKM